MYLPDGTTLRERCMPHPLGGLLFAFEDVTDRLVLERSYNTLIAVQRATLDNLYEGVAVFGSDGRMKLHNPAFARIWDIPDAALIAEPHISDLVERMRPFYDAKADWPPLKERIVESLTARDGTHARIARNDGRVLDYAVVPLPDGATQLSYVDVTDRLRVEQALRDAFGKYKDRTVFVDVITDQTENVWPMVQGGKGLTEMLLGSEDL